MQTLKGEAPPDVRAKMFDLLIEVRDGAARGAKRCASIEGPVAPKFREFFMHVQDFAEQHIDRVDAAGQQELLQIMENLEKIMRMMNLMMSVLRRDG